MTGLCLQHGGWAPLLRVRLRDNSLHWCCRRCIDGYVAMGLEVEIVADDGGRQENRKAAGLLPHFGRRRPAIGVTDRVPVGGDAA